MFRSKHVTVEKFDTAILSIWIKLAAVSVMAIWVAIWLYQYRENGSPWLTVPGALFAMLAVHLASYERLYGHLQDAAQAKVGRLNFSLRIAKGVSMVAFVLSAGIEWFFRGHG